MTKRTVSRGLSLLVLLAAGVAGAGCDDCYSYGTATLVDTTVTGEVIGPGTFGNAPVRKGPTGDLSLECMHRGECKFAPSYRASMPAGCAQMHGCELMIDFDDVSISGAPTVLDAQTPVSARLRDMGTGDEEALTLQQGSVATVSKLNGRMDVIVNLVLSRANHDLFLVNATSIGQTRSEPVCTAD